jgi:hypothetical protein
MTVFVEGTTQCRYRCVVFFFRYEKLNFQSGPVLMTEPNGDCRRSRKIIIIKFFTCIESLSERQAVYRQNTISAVDF